MSDPVPQHFWERVAPATEDLGFAGLVLASRSPQRKLLLEQLGIPFRIVVSEHEEGVVDGSPAHTVQQNARGKAEEVLAREQLRPGELVLGVDTVVVSEGEILGKASDEAEATRFVRRLAAGRHEVYSGLYLTTRKVAVASHAVTGVTFRSLTDGEVAAYIGSGEWRGRAGRLRHPGHRLGAGAARRRRLLQRRRPAGRRTAAPARQLRRHALLLALTRAPLASSPLARGYAPRVANTALRRLAPAPPAGLPSGGHAQRHRIQSSFEIRFERSSPSASSVS